MPERVDYQRGYNFSKKVERLYLVLDIVHNCTVKVQNASFYLKSMKVGNGAERELQKCGRFKVHVLQVLLAWE